MSRIVVALGGNALGKTPVEQLKLVQNTAKSLVDLIAKGNEVIIAHGNGPQVGMINLAMQTAATSEANTPEMPFPECGAMSQGYIGFHLQNAIGEELKNQQIDKHVATVVTQVVVDRDDEAFQNPTKPIGSFYSEEEAKTLVKEKGYSVKEDSGRGFRRVVPSPKPIDVVEKDIVQTLIEAGHVPITVGGGGIPVIKDGNKLIGVPAVIDKDFASSKIAELIEADYLFILTAVDHVSIHFNTPEQIDLERISVNQIEAHIKEGHFAEGSMLPKVEAAIKFAKSKAGRVAVIASLEKAKDALEGNSGTTITL
ncbi:carbamate kinase [Haloplasma contractile]|uniref:Carbamate kinase n=1 Tax=Haloplasma contractile SSD-17B TaxID=1033810 RepID=U2FFC4_9MOLU|nr:carbamate kinase [Haloplasma contractile]ERJ11615.1 Carbamate kinase protein [Haloplasma contractile SSD-17B]